MDIISVATFIILFLTGQAVDLIHMFLNRSLPPVAATALLLFLFAFRSAFNKDIAGKVVLITGAYSGIRKHLAYSYAKRGACLALVARRENRLRDVASLAYQWGSPDVVIIQGDVSMAEDCERFINQTIDHCGCLDHLMTNAGIAPICMFEDCPNITKLAPAMGQVTAMLIRSVEVAAEEMVKGTCRGDNYLTEPAQVELTCYRKVFCPEVLQWCNRLLLLAGTKIS